MKKTILAALLVLHCVGCQTAKVYSNMYFDELSTYKAQMRIENNELIVKLDNILGLMVYELQHTNEAGNILVGAHRISSGSGKREYRITLSTHTLPVDISRRIYWVDPDGSRHQLYPQYL